ncbi:PAS domain-containing protein [Planktomarina sp.]|uniref:PAS domain-containing protein n=1 Tax=Planktomarina sp. TaxID=2024851 RepID=UPI003C414030
MLGIVEQNLLISGLVFFATLIAMSSGYALLRKNLSEAARALRADHSHRNTGQTAGNLYDHRPNAAELHPYPIWVTSHDRHVTWGNKAFKNSESDFVATCKHWLSIGQTDGRIQAHSGAGQISWYDITAQLQDHETLWFASPVDGEVRAEASRREFIQTMSKTFAQLSTGLAIFDRKRTLIHFNPALLDITGLDFEALSLKPDLASFLDTLRTKGFLPEPKDYGDWRDRLARLESAAEKGSYRDIWEPRDGVTYRVTGKPHPDGAIAFLLEDISAETALAREARAELCLLENALNTVTAPLVIFDGLGAYVRSNSAFQSIWPEIAQKNSAEKSLSGCLQLWQKQLLPHDAWNKMRGTVLSRGDRKCWNAVLSSKKGQPFALQCTPLSNRHTLIELGPGNLPASVTHQQSVA